MIQDLMGYGEDKHFSYDIITCTKIINNIEDKEIVSVDSGAVVLVNTLVMSGEKILRECEENQWTIPKDSSSGMTREKGFHE